MTPTVPRRATIIVKNFENGRFLPTPNDSALAQDLPDVEVVVVDDGSTDGSAEIVRSYGDRIVPVCKANGGQAAALNAGFARATGEVVLLLDADDWFADHKVSAVMAVLGGQRELGWCFHPLAYDREDRSPVTPPVLGRIDATTAMRRGQAHQAFAPATSGLAFRHELLGRILPMPEELRVPLPGGARGTAADAYVKVAALGLAPGWVLGEALAVQRLHGTNAYTGTRWADPKRAALELRIAEELRDRWPHLRRYAFRKGDGGLQRLAAIDEVDAGVHAVADAFVDGCRPAERARVRLHQLAWRVRGVRPEPVGG
jgi:glycosyltransferase involved in cell wall biosynthesis